MLLLDLIAQGEDPEKIPSIIGLVPETFQKHLDLLLRKLGARDIRDAIAYANSHGWSQLEKHRHVEAEHEKLEKLAQLISAKN
jgi:hypothetical protein